MNVKCKTNVYCSNYYFVISLISTIVYDLLVKIKITCYILMNAARISVIWFFL
jgi:hypothetical protein